MQPTPAPAASSASPTCSPGPSWSKKSEDDCPMSPDDAEKADTVDDEEIVEAELIDDDLASEEAPGGMDDMLGALGGLDMSSLLGSAMEMQQQMIQAQQEAAETEVEGQSGGGVVRVVTTGGFEF